MRKRISLPSPAIAEKSGVPRGCKPRYVARKASTIAELVDHYEKSQETSDTGWNPLRSLLEGYRELNDLKAAINSAALAEDLVGKSYRKEGDGKVRRHGHQRRIKRSVLENARRVLASKANTQKFKCCRSFEEIFELVARCCDQIPGTGPLYVYDTTLRIGAFTKKLPKLVHLQAGALLGARALGLDVKKSPLPVSDFPKVMQCLAPHEIEDFLCIYKETLSKIKS
jgi:hypothetical protein